MSRLKTMNYQERESWTNFTADGLVFAWFLKVLLANWTSQPDARSPEDLVSIYIMLIIITIVYHTAISIVFALSRRKDGIESDERDIVIRGEGDRSGYLALQLGCGVILISGLMSFVAGDFYLSPVRVDTPVQFILGLTAISYVASLIRHGVILWRYGSQ